MAEDDSIAQTETTEVPAPVKKTRAPRQKKEAVAKDVATAVIAASAGPAKPSDGRRKKATTAPASAEGALKATRAKRLPKAPAQTASVALPDAFEDLMKLEEENQRLRKLLSDKLRSENADLRKKLGHA